MNLLNVTAEHVKNILYDFRNVVLSLIANDESNFCPSRFVSQRKGTMSTVWIKK